MLSAQRPPQRPSAVLERDAALTRVGRLRRLVLFGSAALSAAFAGLVSTTPLGKASARTPARARPTAPRPGTRIARAPALPPLAGADQLGLQGPSVAPSDGSATPATPGDSGQAAPAPDPSSQPASPAPPAVSGGS